jgi:hypothetical protein
MSDLQPSKLTEIDAINVLLSQIGIQCEVGEFLINHLTDVFREQYSGAVVESVDIQRVHNVSAGGISRPDSTIVDMYEYSIPMDVGTVVRVGNERYRLEVHVVIRSNTVEGNVVSNVFIRSQARI